MMDDKFFHMLASGHINYYMKEWRNLYRYEQEGWEFLNALIKSTYYKHTQRGEFVCKDTFDNTEDSILSNRGQSVGKWIVRNILWKSGKAFDCAYGKLGKSNTRHLSQ